MNQYLEFPPSEPLKPYVVCNWLQTFQGTGPHSHRIIPDGCVDIVFIGDRKPLVIGPNTKDAVVSFEVPTEVVGIRLKPGVAAAVLKENIRSLVDQEILLEDLWGSRSPKLREHSDRREKRRLLESIVSHRQSMPDSRVVDAVGCMAANPNQKMENLASRYGLTPRHFLRLFETHVGYGPKALARILRLQRAFSIAASGCATFSDVALAAGYSDQSHMNREFRSLSSEIPSILLVHRDSTLAMSDLFKIA